MKTCPVCQQTLTDTAKFCYYCGASLLSPVTEAPLSPSEAAPADLQEELAEPTIEAELETVIAPESEPEPVSVPEPEPMIIPEQKPLDEPAFEHESEPDQTNPSADAPAVERKSEPIIVATDSHSLMTTVGYIFTTILFHIPVIGLIFMIVWGCGKTKNISRKRFSLAFLIMRLILYIVVLAAAVFVLICFSGVINSLWEAVKPILFA